MVTFSSSAPRPLLLAALLTALACPTHAQPEPVLRIETEMHTAPISRIDVDAAGRFLVTGSDDKTVRVWDLESGSLLRVLRPPIGDGNEGKIYAVAISPDGEIVAAGGWTRFHYNDIYLFERQSGRLRRRIPGLPNAVLHLAFDRDGTRLAATLGGSNGLRVFRAVDGEELGRDTAYGGDSYGADFDADGRLVTSSYDGHVRLYGHDLELVAKAKAPGGERPFGVALSPDGRRIAVGYDDTTRIDALQGDNLRLLYSADSQGANTNLGNVAWSADGSVLFAAGCYGRDGTRLIRRWTDAGRGAYRDLGGPQSTVMALRALSDGRLVYGAADPAWGVLNATGEIVRQRRPEIAATRGLYDSFLVDASGGTIRFAFESLNKRPVTFSLTERHLAENPKDDTRLSPPRLEAEGVDVTGWNNTTEPRLNGRLLPLMAYETAFSAAIAPDGLSFLLGTHYWLRSFTHTGEERWKKPVPGVAWAVNVTPDGRLAVAAFGDGTIRWFRYADGEELLAFFPHADGRRWVLWTPSGYYDASPDGEDLIGWHVGNGPDAAADFVSARVFRDRFHRPQVIDAVLDVLDEARAVQIADMGRPRPAPKTQVADLQPPIVEILSPADGAVIGRSPVAIEVDVRSPSGREVTALRVYVDGRPVPSPRGALEFDPTPISGGRRILEVQIPPRDCSVQVAAETDLAVGEPRGVKLRWAGPVGRPRPDLYVLAVGVSGYRDEHLDLRYAAHDARDVAAAWETQKGRLYGNVRVRTLVDDGAGKDAILDGLEWLERQVSGDDVAVVFLAGHGRLDPRTQAFYFLPHEADAERRRSSNLWGNEIVPILQSISGKVVVFLDACHAGSLFGGLRQELDITRFINELTDADNGVVVYAASTGSQASQESESWQNGAFTQALVNGLRGGADLDKDGAIYVEELGHFVDREVRRLTSGQQTPTMVKPDTVQNFPLALTSRGEHM